MPEFKAQSLNEEQKAKLLTFLKDTADAMDPADREGHDIEKCIAIANENINSLMDGNGVLAPGYDEPINTLIDLGCYEAMRLYKAQTP